MEKTIVTILSTNYAGSHYLSLLLGSNSRAEHIGEVHHLGKESRKNKISRQICNICGNNKCTLFRGVDQSNINRIYDIIFSNVSPDVTTLIDTSKKPSWASRFIPLRGYTMKYIHLLRDPRALARRWSLAYETFHSKTKQKFRTARRMPAHAFNIVFSSMANAYTYRWLYENQQISNLLWQNNLDYQVVTYYDLTTNTAQELKRITEWIGLEFEPSQLEYWNFLHHGGKRARFQWIKQQHVTNYLDIRWKSFLNSEQQKLIVMNPYIDRYLSQLNISFTNDGLTKNR